MPGSRTGLLTPFYTDAFGLEYDPFWWGMHPWEKNNCIAFKSRIVQFLYMQLIKAF